MGFQEFRKKVQAMNKQQLKEKLIKTRAKIKKEKSQKRINKDFMVVMALEAQEQELEWEQVKRENRELMNERVKKDKEQKRRLK